MKALVLVKNASLQFTDKFPVPKIGDQQCLVSVSYAGICNSDIWRAFNKGAYHYPLVMGHEFSGVINKVGSGVQNRKVGERVAVFPLLPCFDCRSCAQRQFAQCASYDYYGSRRHGGFAESVAVNEWNLVPLPAGLPLAQAAMLELIAVGIHAARLAYHSLADKKNARILVLGAGVIGQVVARYLADRMSPKNIFVLDRNTEKVHLAVTASLNSVPYVPKGQWIPGFLKQTGGGADCIIEATGSQDSFVHSIQAARPKGQVVWVGNIHGSLTMEQAVVSSILRKELRIQGAWNSHFDPESQVEKDDWQEAISFLQKHPAGSWISHTVDLSEGREMFEELRRRKIDGKKPKKAIFKAVFKI